MVFKYHHFLPAATMLLSRNQKSVVVLCAVTDARRCFNPPFDTALPAIGRAFVLLRS
jgi:hypothetical protein